MTEYNRIYDRLVGDLGSHPDTTGIIAYGIYKQSTREWAQNIRSTENRKPNEAELQQYVASWTEIRLQGALDHAEQILGRFAEEVVANERPHIEKRALEGRFWGGVFQSTIGAFCYSIILLLLFLITTVLGVDLVNVFRVAS